MAPVTTIFTDNSTLTLNITNPFPFTPSTCDDLNNCRSLSDIVWSCVVVVFMCTWIAIHPNVPSPEDSFVHYFISRLKILCVALIAPELIILWAMRQWVVAKKMAEEFKHHGWTMTHGFLVLMGGFMLYSEHGAEGVLTYEGEKVKRPETCDSEAPLPLLHPHFEDGCIVILKDEITRCTSDALGKLVTVIQVGWFIIQCIARAIEGLAITELEIVTLGFAILNFVTYAVWWHKPLNLKAPFPVHRSRRDTLSTGPPPGDKSSYLKRRYSPSGFFRKIPDAYRLAANQTLRTLQRFGLAHPHLKFMIPFFYPLHLLYDLVHNSIHVFGPERPREHVFRSKFSVPTFYTGLSEDPIELSLSVYFIAVILGAVHLTAWNFEFPTRPEQMLWRGTALMVTCGPVFAAISQAIMRHVCSNYDGRSIFSRFLLNCLRLVVGIMVSIQAVFYVLCRVSLLVQAIVLLRALPPSAYQTVQWVNFVPHV